MKAVLQELQDLFVEDWSQVIAVVLVILITASIVGPFGEAAGLFLLAALLWVLTWRLG